MQISKRIYVGLLTAAAGLSVAVTAWAAAWTSGGDGGYYTIRSIEASSENGYLVHIDGGLSANDRGTCQADYITAAAESWNKDIQSKAVLAAFLAGRKVRFHLMAGCSGGDRKKYSDVAVHKEK